MFILSCDVAVKLKKIEAEFKVISLGEKKSDFLGKEQKQSKKSFPTCL